MESFIHPDKFGSLVRSERLKRNMNQIAFYNYLFPNNEKEEETIKKKMNSIENGKQKSVDFEMLLAICQKCDVSADYILGLKKDYRNQDYEFICAYTGLDVNAVHFLHRWALDKSNGADLSMIGKAYFEGEEEEMKKAYNKQTAIIFLRIINFLFKEGKLPSDDKRKKGELYSNLRILYSLFRMCMAKPKTITGTPAFDESDNLNEYMTKNCLDPHTQLILSKALSSMKIDGKEVVIMEDDNDMTYFISMKKILEQIARQDLDRALDDLISAVRYEELNQ